MLQAFLGSFLFHFLLPFAYSRICLLSLIYVALCYSTLVYYRSKLVPIFLFVLSLLSTIASSILFFTHIDVRFLSLLFEGNCSDFLCVNSPSYHFTFAVLSFFYLRTQPSSDILPTVPIISHPYVKLPIVLLAFVFYPTPSFVVIFLIVSFYFSNFISQKTYRYSISFFHFFSFIAAPISANLELGWIYPDFLPLPAKFGLTMHFIFLGFSLLVHTSPYFYKEAPLRPPPTPPACVESLGDTLVTSSQSNSINLSTLVSFIGFSLALLSTTSFKSVSGYLLLTCFLILLLTRSSLFSKPKSFKLFIYLLLTCFLIFLSFPNDSDYLAIFYLAGSMYCLCLPWKLKLSLNAIMQYRLFSTILTIFVLFCQSYFVFCASFFLTIHFPTVPYVFSFLLSLHYVLHPLNTSKIITNLVLILTFLFSFVFYYPYFQNFDLHICTVNMSTALAFCTNPSFLYSIYLFILVSSVSYVNSFLLSINSATLFDRNRYFNTISLVKSVTGVVLLGVFLSLRISLLEIIILSVLILLVVFPIFKIKSIIFDFIGLLILVLTIFILFAVQYEPFMEHLYLTAVPNKLVEILARFEFKNYLYRTIFLALPSFSFVAFKGTSISHRFISLSNPYLLRFSLTLLLSILCARASPLLLAVMIIGVVDVFWLRFNENLRRKFYLFASGSLIFHLILQYLVIHLSESSLKVEIFMKFFGLSTVDYCQTLFCKDHFLILFPTVLSLLISLSFSVQSSSPPHLSSTSLRSNKVSPTLLHTTAILFSWSSILSKRDPFLIVFGILLFPLISSRKYFTRKLFVNFCILILTLDIIGSLITTILSSFFDTKPYWLESISWVFYTSSSSSSLFFSLHLTAIFLLSHSCQPHHALLSSDSTSETVEHSTSFSIVLKAFPLVRPLLVCLLFIFGIQRASLPALFYVATALNLIFSDKVFSDLKKAQSFTARLFWLNISVLIFHCAFQASFFRSSSDPLSLFSLLGLRKFPTSSSAFHLTGVFFDLAVLLVVTPLDVLVHSEGFKQYLLTVNQSRNRASALLIEDEKLSKLRRDRILAEREAGRIESEQRIEFLRQQRLRRSTSQIDLPQDITHLIDEPVKIDSQSKSPTEEITTPVYVPTSFIHRIAFKLQVVVCSTLHIRINELPERHQKDPLRWISHTIRQYSVVLACTFCYLSALWFPSIPTVLIAFLTASIALMSKKRGTAHFWQFILGIYLALLLIHYISYFPFICYCKQKDEVVLSLGRTCLSTESCPIPPEIIEPLRHATSLSRHLVYLLGIVPIGSVFLSYTPLLLACLSIVFHRSVSMRTGRWEENGDDQQSLVEGVKNAIKKSWEVLRSLTKPKHDPIGIDLYPALFFVDILQLISLPFAFFSSSTAGQDVLESVRLSYLPGSLAIWLIFQFIIIIIDRSLFYLRLLSAKILLHLFSTFIALYVFCFVFPSSNGELPIMAPFLIVAATLRFIHACLSSIQICLGFPPPSFDYFLMKGYGNFNNYSYQAFRAIPFLYELRCLLDWTLTRTSLEFSYWMRVEDIYSSLFLIKCRRVKIAKIGRKFGDPQPLFDKIVFGLLFFIVLVLILCVPLVIYSSANPVGRTNQIQGGSLSISVNDYLPFFQQHEFKSVNTLTSSEFNQISSQFPLIFKEAEPQDSAMIRLYGSSDSMWGITPPALNGLLESLRNGEGFIKIHMGFVRKNPANLRTINGETVLKLSRDQCIQLANLIDGNIDWIVIPMLPPAVLVPVSEDPLFSDSFARANVTVERVGAQVFWSIRDVVSQHSFYFYTHSMKITVGLGAYATTGLLGLYVSLILGVGRFLRMAFEDSKVQIFVSALPDPDRLIKICKDLFLARSNGDLVLEESIYKEIVRIYRDPELLMVLTEKKVQQ
ncbi:hypothetical protein RCL1_002522 [Eukaryota sp. TZLM3-RCL]